VLVVRKTENYVTYIYVRVPYGRDSRVKEAKPRKGKEAEQSSVWSLLIVVGPVVRPLCTRTACSTEGDEGDLSEALQQRSKQDCKSYPIAWDTCSHYIVIID
jgi:hypothetical protein